MKIRSVLVATILVLGCTSVSAQSSFDIESKYGKRVEVYSVSETLWMTPNYDSEGQMCLMRVYPKAVSANTNYLDPSLNLDETLKFINELVPVHTRGRRGGWFGLSSLGGGTVWTGFEYEHVRFTFISTFRITKNPKELDGEYIHLDFPVNDKAEFLEYQRQQAMKSDDQLIREHVHDARVLQIAWTNRKCKKS